MQGCNIACDRRKFAISNVVLFRWRRESFVHEPIVREGSREEQRFGAAKGSNLDRLRAHNLSAVLTRLHHEGPSSRSSLASATGLNRSTVTILVNELIELGLAVEPTRPSDDGAKKSFGQNPCRIG